MRRSVSVQSAEARLVLESRRRVNSSRGVRRQSPPPGRAESDIYSGARICQHIEDAAGTCSTAKFRPTSSSKSPLMKDSNSGRRRVRAPPAEPPRASVEHEGGQPKGSLTLAAGRLLAAGKCLAPEDREQQQQRPAADLGELSARTKHNEHNNGDCRRLRPPATGQGTAPFGSEEYLANRRRRAAQCVEVVRQCAAGLDKMSSLISNEAARRAQSLVRRLAAEKQRKAQPLTGSKNEQPPPAASLNLAKEEGRCGKRETCVADGLLSPAAQRSMRRRRPWRAGASSTAWAEGRRVKGEPRRLENTAHGGGGGVDGGTCGAVKNQARATVERIVRRACLNLANRPWRLAGVRLSIDRRSHAAGCPRHRVRRARDSKDGPAAALSELQAVHGGTASNGTEFCGWARRGGGTTPRHRRLVRARTSPEGSRGLGATRPSPPDRRHAASAGWGRGAEADRGQETDTMLHPGWQGLLHDGGEARRPEGFASGGGQGWLPRLEHEGATDSSRGVAEEGLPSSSLRTLNVEPPAPRPSSRRGRSCPARAKTHGNWRGGRTRHLSGGSSAHRQLPKRPRWDSRFWVNRAPDISAVTTPTCEKGPPPSGRVACGQDLAPRAAFAAVEEDGMVTDNSTTSSEGYSTSTFVAETVASPSSAADSSASRGDETWSDSGGTHDDASVASASPLDRRREVERNKKPAPAAAEQSDDEDVWYAGDVTALYELQPAFGRKAVPELIEDARMFAMRLTRLAEGRV